MSINERSRLQEHAAQKQEKPRQKPDQRIRRTHARLGSALVELIQEKSIDDVTVQEVLDRAKIGRSTFYLHFRDKDDLLLSQFETFLETMTTMLSIRGEESHRVVPVAEMFAHIGSGKKFYRVLADSAVSTTSSSSRKATLRAGLRGGSGNPSVLRSFRNVNWLLAPLPCPGACCRY